jgi:hypothetical protein
LITNFNHKIVEISAREEDTKERLTAFKSKHGQDQQVLQNRRHSTILESGLVDQKSVKRSYDMIDSSDEPTSAPVVKKQGIELFDSK